MGKIKRKEKQIMNIEELLTAACKECGEDCTKCIMKEECEKYVHENGWNSGEAGHED